MGGERSLIILDIAARGEDVRVGWVERNPAGFAALSAFEAHVVRAERVDRLCRALFGALDAAMRRSGSAAHAQGMLRRAGIELFDELLPAGVKALLRHTTVRDVLLVVDESVSHIPWELLHTGFGYLSVLFNVGRVVRTAPRPVNDARSIPRDRRPRVWVVCDPRGDLTASYNEGLALRDVYAEFAEVAELHFRSGDVGVDELRAGIREFDILHYAGHARAGRGDGGSRLPGWGMWDGVFGPGDVLRAVGGAPMPSVVVANGCASGRVSPGQGVPAASGQAVERTSLSAVTSMAHAFLEAGTRHFVGTLWDIPDECGEVFATAFHRTLLRGESIGRALVAARGALISAFGTQGAVWASYVLYGDPTAVVFDPPAHSANRLAESSGVAMPPPPPLAVRGGARAANAASRGVPAASNARARVLRRVRGAATYRMPLDGLGGAGWRSTVRGALQAAGLVLTAVAALWVFFAAGVRGHRAELTVHLRPAPPSVDIRAVVPPPLPARRHLVTSLEVVALQFRAGNGGVRRNLPPGGMLAPGESLQVRAVLSRPAWAALVHVDPTGTARVLRRWTPQNLHGSDGSFRLRAPSASEWYAVDRLPGVQTLILVADTGGPVTLSDETLAALRAAYQDVLVHASEAPWHAPARIGIVDGRPLARPVRQSIVDHTLLASSLRAALKGVGTDVAVTSFEAY